MKFARIEITKLDLMESSNPKDLIQKELDKIKVEHPDKKLIYHEVLRFPDKDGYYLDVGILE